MAADMTIIAHLDEANVTSDKTRYIHNSPIPPIWRYRLFSLHPRGSLFNFSTD